MNMDLPIDPALPEGFDNTPNDERSQEELDAWWDRPFAVTTHSGKFSVRCLHGGAWDRSSWMGDADTIDDAKALAQMKLAEWHFSRTQPNFHLHSDLTVSIVRMAQRPDDEETVLATFNSLAEAQEFYKREFPQYDK